MAAATLLTLLDDIATVLDDIALYSKLAAKKTAPVLGDDLAVNVEQVVGAAASRELPIIWAVAKGSLLNKCIIVPLALLISAFMPPLVNILLMFGGAYLCFEGVEKVIHSLLAKQHQPAKPALLSETQKIKGAIRTDFILSAEIIVIALGAMQALALPSLIIALSLFAIGITVGIYGLIAMIVKIDDLGLWLLTKPLTLLNNIGQGLLWLAPRFMKLLSFLGTIAMFFVGGGIISHGISFVHHAQESLAQGFEGWLQVFVSQTFTMLVGIIIGLVIVFTIKLAKVLFSK